MSRSNATSELPSVKPSPSSLVQQVQIRLQRLITLYGITGLVRICSAKFIGMVLWLTPSRRRARAALIEKDCAFDRQWGVNTSGRFVPEESNVIGPRWIHGLRYEGVDPDRLQQVLKELPIDPRDFTFIDMGSGKGRAILVASRFPFRKVIGVEYSESLHQIARKNIEIFRDPNIACTDVEAVWDDVLNFPIPAGPLLIFANNPFNQSVMAGLIKRISESYQQAPRRIVVVYFHALLVDLWQAAEFLHTVKTSKAVSVFDSVDLNAGLKRAA